MNYNQSIYEINTRVWLHRFDKGEKKSTLVDVPNSYWEDFVKKGIDFIWLMGIWKTCDSAVEKYCFEEELIKNYDRALKGWKREDVIGSPYAIDVYEISPAIGNLKSLLELKSQLNKKGIKLILDFVPNHFNAESRLIKSKPEIFLSVDKKFFERDRHTFYQPFQNEQKYYAHGRDPFFSAWQDTIQVNFFSSEARNFLTNILIDLTKVCDGVRCDMAMLMLNNVFRNTWGGVLSNKYISNTNKEFWMDAIEKVKYERPDFLFIAEVYWNLEWDLQQLGFDYTYDKKLTDRLKSALTTEISDHLQAEHEYQKKSLRFIENHDEERAITHFGKGRSKAAAIIISTIQGMRFYHDGQFEGKKIKLPVQLGREPDERPIKEIKNFYDKLFSITTHDIFKKGKWILLEPASSWAGNDTYKNMLAWLWTLREEKRVVIINYSEVSSTCRLKLDIRGYAENFEIVDLLNDQSYSCSAEEVFHSGLCIELKPYNAHIIAF